MSGHRFYIPSTALEEGMELELPATISRQIAKVLRMREHERIVLFNGTDYEWPAEIHSVQQDAVSVLVETPVRPGTEPEIKVSVCQALIPSERMEFVVQKSTELGASRIIPLLTERVQAKDRATSHNRLNRWGRIAIEAAEQSGRTSVPEILPPETLDECLVRAKAEGPVILMWEGEEEMSLGQAVRESLGNGAGHVSVLIGPVGGLSVAEAEAGRSAGALVAGAGARVLRAETAPVVALTALMYEAGELGPRNGARR